MPLNFWPAMEDGVVGSKVRNFRAVRMGIEP